MNTYKSTRHAKFLINYHFIWTPKYRRHILKGDSIKSNIINSINDCAKRHDFEILAVEIMPDHIDLFLSAYPRYSPSQIMNIIKGETGKSILNEFPELKANGSIWTPAYFVGTAGNVSSETIKRYVEEQTNKL